MKLCTFSLPLTDLNSFAEGQRRLVNFDIFHQNDVYRAVPVLTETEKNTLAYQMLCISKLKTDI